MRVVRRRRGELIMTYLETSNGAIITRERAIREIIKHGVTEIDLFLKDLGNKDLYEASNVLAWLGY